MSLSIYAAIFFLQPAKSRKRNKIVRNYIVFGNDCVRLVCRERTCYVLKYYVHVYFYCIRKVDCVDFVFFSFCGIFSSIPFEELVSSTFSSITKFIFFFVYSSYLRPSENITQKAHNIKHVYTFSVRCGNQWTCSELMFVCKLCGFFM